MSACDSNPIVPGDVAISEIQGMVKLQAAELRLQAGHWFSHNLIRFAHNVLVLIFMAKSFVAGLKCYLCTSLLRFLWGLFTLSFNESFGTPSIQISSYGLQYHLDIDLG
jgi:hypothetical protein